MTVTTNIQTVPRRIVNGYLQAVRLPLTAVERAVKQQSNEQWPPALAFERFEASVETVVGSLLRDSALVRQGRLRQAKLAQLAKAGELEVVAAQASKQAEQRLEQQRDQLSVERAETQRRAEQRKQELDRQADLHERKVQEKARKKSAAGREVKAMQDQTISRQERTATVKALNAESRALDMTKNAVDAEETVEVINDTLEGSKAARKSS